MGSEVTSRPTIQRLREVLAYDPITGVLRWARRTSPHQNARLLGQRAGWFAEGRYHLEIDGKNLFAAVVAWAHSSGAWPTKEIDHVNGDPGDDRLINLREATHAQNQANRRKGLHSVQKGVKRSRSGNRWEARLIVNQSYRHLGTFDTPEEAHRAYRIAATAAFGEFARFE